MVVSTRKGRKKKPLSLGPLPWRVLGRENGDNGVIEVPGLIPLGLGPRAAINPVSNLRSRHQHHPSPWSRHRRSAHTTRDGFVCSQQHPHSASMPLLSASADTFILGAIICLIAFARRGSAPAPTKNARQPKYRSFITGILALHTIYMIYTLSLKTPPNLFTRLHIPLSMPSQKIRAILLSRTGTREEDTLPEHIEELLTKLNTFDLRAYFVRFVPAL